MRLILIVIAVVALSGCMSSLGVQQMTPDQIKATNGMLTCTKLATAYGQGVATTVNADDVRKGATAKGKITMSPDCAITIDTNIGVAPTVVR